MFNNETLVHVQKIYNKILKRRIIKWKLSIHNITGDIRKQNTEILNYLFNLFLTLGEKNVFQQRNHSVLVQSKVLC